MDESQLSIKNLKEGRNSTLFDVSNKEAIFYEKLSNSIHVGDYNHLQKFQNKVESVDYYPIFESDSLKKRKNDKLEGLVLNVTEDCNLNCTYCIYSGCYKNERTTNKTFMDFEVAKKSIDIFIQESEDPALISFYGGEPLNNMKLIKKIIKYSKQSYPNKNILFSMTSNFYNAERYIDTLAGENLQLLISLDGPKNIHDKYRIHRDRKSTWNKIMRNIQKMKEIYPEYARNCVGYSVTCAHPDEILEIFDFFKSRDDFRVFRIGGIETKGTKKINTSSVERPPIYTLASDFLHLIKENKKIPSVFTALFDQKLMMMSKRDHSKMPEKLMLSGSCYPGKRKLFVNTNGELHMCEKFGDRISIGNSEKGIDKIKVNDSIERFTEIRNQVCTDSCWAQRICTPCIQSAKDATKDISTDGLLETCNSSKSDLLITLALYAKISKFDNSFFEKYET